MTRMVLPGMLERGKGWYNQSCFFPHFQLSMLIEYKVITETNNNTPKLSSTGAIVNVSSGSESQPLPLMTVYAASKTFIKSFSAALRCEYESQGITVQHLAPLFVNTKMNHFSNRLQQSTTMVPDAVTYAEGAVNTLGRLNESAGCWSHGVQSFFVSFTPVSIRTYIGWTLNSLFRRDYHRQLQSKQ